MYDYPVVVWPPGTFYNDCSTAAGWGNFYDCSYEYPDYQAQGAMVCCPGW